MPILKEAFTDSVLCGKEEEGGGTLLNVIPQGCKLSWLISEWLDFLTNTLLHRQHEAPGDTWFQHTNAIIL